MSITVKRELLIPASGNATAEWRNHIYLDCNGLKRREIRLFQNRSDSYADIAYRDSADNGKTWGEWISEEKKRLEQVGNDEIEMFQYPKPQNVWNPIHKHYITLSLQQLYVGGYKSAFAAAWGKGERGVVHHGFIEIANEDRTKTKFHQICYEDGAVYNRENYRSTDYLSTNIGWSSDLLVLKNGDILFNMTVPMDICCRLAGLNVMDIFPSNNRTLSPGVIVCRGKWNEENFDYDLTFSAPLMVSDLISSRGLDEPVFAELTSGKILVVFRTSTVTSLSWNTRICPYAPGCKFFCLSDDGGKTFSTPMPWYFDSREVVYSSATYSLMLRSQKNGRLYWIGNITDPTKLNGSYPRYPLQIAEVDEEWGVLKKNTVTVIDTRRDGESELVQLSNFSIIENRETGDFEIYLAKIGQYNEEKRWDCETWKYTVILPEHDT